jgi:integrase
LWRIKFRHFNEGFLYIEKSKNGDPRSIPVHSQVQGIINRRFTGPDDLMFPDTNVVREPWDKVRETLGWDDVVWHTLRHTFASLLAQGGTDMTVIMGLMGHRNLATTMRYAKLAPKNYREAITTLDV